METFLILCKYSLHMSDFCSLPIHEHMHSTKNKVSEIFIVVYLHEPFLFFLAVFT